MREELKKNTDDSKIILPTIFVYHIADRNTRVLNKKFA